MFSRRRQIGTIAAVILFLNTVSLAWTAGECDETLTKPTALIVPDHRQHGITKFFLKTDLKDLGLAFDQAIATIEFALPDMRPKQIDGYYREREKTKVPLEIINNPESLAANIGRAIQKDQPIYILTKNSRILKGFVLSENPLEFLIEEHERLPEKLAQNEKERIWSEKTYYRPAIESKKQLYRIKIDLSQIEKFETYAERDKDEINSAPIISYRLPRYHPKEIARFGPSQAHLPQEASAGGIYRHADFGQKSVGAKLIEIPFGETVSLDIGEEKPLIGILTAYDPPTFIFPGRDPQSMSGGFDFVQAIDIHNIRRVERGRREKLVFFDLKPGQKIFLKYSLFGRMINMVTTVTSDPKYGIGFERVSSTDVHQAYAVEIKPIE